MWTLFFSEHPVHDYTSAKASDTARFATFFRGMLEAGFYLPPSQFEAAFMGIMHGREEVDAFLAAARSILPRCR